MGETAQMAEMAQSNRDYRAADPTLAMLSRETREKLLNNALIDATDRSPNKPLVPVAEERSWLRQALTVTTSERRRDYGHPLPNFLRIALRMSVTLQRAVNPLEAEHVAVDWKMSRDQNHFKDDNWIDNIGYSNTVQMIDERMKEMGYVGITEFENYRDGDLMKFMFDLLLLHERTYANGL